MPAGDSGRLGELDAPSDLSLTTPSASVGNLAVRGKRPLLFYLGLLGFSFLAISALGAGTRLEHALPCYAVVAMAAILSVFSLKRPSREGISRACLGATGVFFGYVLLRILFSPVDYLARTDLYMVLAGLIVYLITAEYLKSSQHRLVTLALLAIGAAQVAVGVVQFAKGDNFMPIPFLQRADYGQRASGFYICPNHLAGYLEVAGLMGLSLTFWERRPIWKLLIGYVSIVLLVAVVLTGSRGGYLSVVFGLGVLGLLSAVAFRSVMGKEMSRRYLMGGGVLAIVLAAAAAFLFLTNPSLQKRAGAISDTKNMRIELWKGAIEQFKVNPLVGTGSRTYLYYGRRFRPSSVEKDPEFVHNDYLQLLAEFGLVGCAGFFLFFGAHLGNGYRIFRSRIRLAYSLTNRSLALNIGALSAVSAFVVHSVFDFNLHIPANLLLLAFVFGVLARSGRGEIDAATLPLFPGKLSRLALPGLGLWILIGGIPKWPATYYASEAREAVRSGDLQLAISSAQRALAWDNADVDALRHFGWAEADLADIAPSDRERERRYSLAAESFAKALKLFPKDQWLMLELGWVLDGLGRHAEAEPYFLEALEWDSNSAQNHFYYAAHLEAAGEAEKAKLWYRKSIEKAHNQSAAMALERLAAREKEVSEQPSAPDSKAEPQ